MDAELVTLCSSAAPTASRCRSIAVGSNGGASGSGWRGGECHEMSSLSPRRAARVALSWSGVRSLISMPRSSCQESGKSTLSFEMTFCGVWSNMSLQVPMGPPKQLLRCPRALEKATFSFPCCTSNVPPKATWAPQTDEIGAETLRKTSTQLGHVIANM